MTASVWERVRGRYQRDVAVVAARRPLKLANQRPLISFTFDDFPRSALDMGGMILRAHGLRGTYYAALGLLDRDEPVGRICSTADLAGLVEQGHELGCHTFGHCDAWTTSPGAFEASILDNRRALSRVLPGARFETLSYPISFPRPATKRRAGRHFSACRGGSQTNNVGTLDLNHLRAFFLEQSRDRPAAIRGMIERNREQRGWLILATHDVQSNPSPFGCTPRLFEDVIGWAVESGAEVLPVARALARARG